MLQSHEWLTLHNQPSSMTWGPWCSGRWATIKDTGKIWILISHSVVQVLLKCFKRSSLNRNNMPLQVQWWKCVQSQMLKKKKLLLNEKNIKLNFYVLINAYCWQTFTPNWGQLIHVCFSLFIEWQQLHQPREIQCTAPFEIQVPLVLIFSLCFLTYK